MAKWKKFAREAPAQIADEEDEETLASIDEGIQDADAGRVVPAEKARKLLPKWASVPTSSPNLKTLLLRSSPRFEDIAPKRGAWKHRTQIDFS